jgi:hypothetical protein
MQSIFCRPLRFLRIALVSGVSLVASQALAQTGPGGVGSTDGSSSLSAWYRIDNGVSTDGSGRVDSWTNSAGFAELDLTETGNERPTRVNNQVNGYPEISFSGTNRLRTAVGAMNTSNFVTDQASTFVVARADNTTQVSCVYTTDPLVPTTRFSNHIPWSGTVYYDIGTCCDDRIQVASLSNLTSYSVWSYDAINTSAGKQLYRNGALLQSVGVAATPYTSHDTQRFSIGAYGSGSAGFQGDVTEVIIFRQKINNTQRRIIQNYLAAKYGLSLSGDELYTMDNSGNGNFDHDVAGIGRVSATDLHTDSRGTGIVRIYNPVGLDDGEYFFWGHNNGSLTTITSDTPAGIQNRYNRVWRAQEIGDLSSVDIEFDLTGLGSVTTHRLRLLVDMNDDGNFADETPIAGAFSLGSNVYRFSNVTELTASGSASHRFTLAIASLAAPGDVSGNMVWWLKADAAVFNASSVPAADGDAVTLWMDQTSIPNDAANSTGANRPVFRDNIINGYPALEFDGTRFIDATGAMGIGPTESFIIFMVFKQNSYVAGATNNGDGTYIIDRPPPETDNLASFKIVNTDKYHYQRRDNNGNNLGGPVSATPANTENFVLIDYFRYLNGGSSTEGIYINGKLDATTSGPTTNMTAPNLRIGRHSVLSPGGLNGYFVEIVAYDRELGNQDRQRVESYLALKYGITLDPSVDYLRSGGSIIYPSSGTNSGYVHDIAGIGRDDNSALYQPTSRSQNQGNMITMSNPSAFGNNRFLVWGHNNGDLTSPTNADVGGNIELRLSRVWKVSKTGTSLGTVSVTVDMSWVPGPETASDLRLLVDSDEDFSNATEYSVSSSSGDLYTFDNVTFNNEYYFTIGTVDKYNSTLPVELTSFDVTYEPPIVVATWETASETNNDYFTLERAGEDMNFAELLRQPGAGTSSVPRTYTAVDPHPFGGRSYYRLKQTDYDGKTSYSHIRRMDIDETGRELVLYPNPNHGRDMEFSMGNAVFQLQEVEVINSQGITLERLRIDAPSVNRHTIHLDKALRPGFYLVRAKYNGKWKAFRVVVE